MNRLLCIVSLCLLIIFPVYAEDPVRASDIRSISLGGNGVIQSVLFNPAVLSLTGKRELSTSYYNRFLMKGMGTASVSFQYPNRVLDAGLAFSSFGNKTYRESLLTLSVSKRLNTRFTAGLLLDYRFLSSLFINETPSWIGVGLGITYKPSNKVSTGFSIINLPLVAINNPMKVSTNNQYSVRGGIAWQFISSLLLTAEVENNKEFPVTGSLGVEYKPIDFFVYESE